jgi:hypothetical protein
MDISVLLKFHGYEYGYALNIHGYSHVLCPMCYLPSLK